MGALSVLAPFELGVSNISEVDQAQIGLRLPPPGAELRCAVALGLFVDDGTNTLQHSNAFHEFIPELVVTGSISQLRQVGVGSLG
jgi:hypothetical protein